MLLRILRISIRFLLALLALLLDGLVLVLALFLFDEEPLEESKEVQVLEILRTERQLSNNDLNELILELQFSKHLD
jgi:hypothetical protein